jgi:hypothetical protein
MSAVYHQIRILYAKWQISYYLIEIQAYLLERTGSATLLNSMMILYQNIPANMITSVQNVRIQKLLTNGLILLRIL